MMDLAPAELGDLSRLLRLEWLETNGLGSYAMGTVAGANTRRYHGLLCAAVRPPVDRRMMLQALEVEVRSNGERFPLSTHLYGETVHPDGWTRLTGFRLDPWPVWTYRAGNMVIEQAVFMPHGRNVTVVQYTCLEAEHPLSMCNRVLLAPRDHHHLGCACVDFEMDVEMHKGEPTLVMEGYPPLTLQIIGGDFWPSSDWYYRFTYPEEQARGLDYIEDLYTPGAIEWTLRAGETATLIASTEGPLSESVEELMQAERARREALVAGVAEEDEVARKLLLAADQFVVARPDQGPTAKSIIAGYPWFGDWGRDSMIAFHGLLLSTGRFEEAKGVLRAYAAAMEDGLIPNLFSEEGGGAAYNTVDATLWMFVAAKRYYERTGDLDFFRDELFDRLVWAITLHMQGTRYGIGMDEDGLLSAGDESSQLTWMDAKVGDWVVTPRHGKAVEINALWYSAVRTLEFFARKLDRDYAKYARLARQIKESFVREFWSEELGYCYDCVRGEEKDASLRPNQILALALPYSLLSVDQERSVLRVVTEKLLTPYGLRTLSPEDPAYRGRYEGDPVSRDGAYHQGTVWPWLLGPYLSAYFVLSNRSPESKQWVRELVQPLLDHLSGPGLGQLPEVFDGDPPHRPGGCPAQAWSVAALLRIWVDTHLGDVS